MFGHQDDQQVQQTDNQAIDQSVNAVMNNDVTPPPAGQTFSPPAPVVPDSPYSSLPSSTVTPTTNDMSSLALPDPTPPAPAADAPVMTVPEPPAETPDEPLGDGGSSFSAPTADDLPAPDSGVGVDANQLLDIKQQALGQLTPLVGHLEQSPEEKFRTTMMMIQASDNQSLIKEAYAAAQEITDEKTKAQALLDVVNEINYFTQQNNS